ncbi:MAG: phosphocholine cytidylyltransferase family protein [Polyangia bacterium]
MSSSKVIIVAAGRGRRLGPETEDIPKCMVRVAGQPILHWQLRAFAAAGLSEIVVVRGYRGDRIDGGGAGPAFVDNPHWAHNNILASLLCAAEHMPGGFFFSYCDIVYTPDVVARLAARARAAHAAPVSLIIDRGWADAYEGRTLHPVSEAELTQVDGQGRVVRVGKGAVARDKAVGEFIGLAHFSAAGAAALHAVWDAALAARGLEAPFGLAATLRQAYLTDALNVLAEQGIRLEPVFIDGQWREIDTPQDLAAAQTVVAGWA